MADARPGSPRPSGQDSNNGQNQTQGGHQVGAKSSLMVLDVQRGTNGDRKSKSVLSNHSDRVVNLLISLGQYDSLYLCPITGGFPDAVKAKLPCEPVRQYEIKDYYGETCFYAAELTSPNCYKYCANNRAFTIFMYTPAGELVFESVRSASCQLCLCGVDCFFSGGIETCANFRRGGNYIGSVITEGNCCTPTFVVHNDEFDEKFYIRGPTAGFVFPCRLCRITSFPICKPKTRASLGKIMYGYDGLTESLVPNPLTVGVIFPPRCTPEIKALLLAAGFMLDVTYFQKRGCTAHRILRHLLTYFFIIGGTLLLLFIFYKNDRPLKTDPNES